MLPGTRRRYQPVPGEDPTGKRGASGHLINKRFYGETALRLVPRKLCILLQSGYEIRCANKCKRCIPKHLIPRLEPCCFGASSLVFMFSMFVVARCSCLGCVYHQHCCPAVPNGRQHLHYCNQFQPILT